MTPYYSDDSVTVWHGDCLDLLDVLADESVDAVVTDPPYGISFMGREWDQPDQYGSQRRGGSDRPFTAGPIGVDHKTTTERSASMHAGKYDLSPNAMQSFQRWCEAWARECLRVLRPGGHLLAFGGARTWHRLAAGVEDAGFEIRDSIAWLYGSGFPKSLDVSKAIDKRRDWSLVSKLAEAIRAARAESGLSLREVGDAVKAASSGTHGEWYHRGGHMFFETGLSLPGRSEWKHLRIVLPIPAEFDAMYEEAERQVIAARQLTDRRDDGTVVGLGHTGNADITAPATDAARRWQGWGTALKPAFEPIVVARKPLQGTVAANVLTHGTGALNIDGCRVQMSDADRAEIGGMTGFGRDGYTRPRTDETFMQGTPTATAAKAHDGDRWPANVVLDEDQGAALDEQSGTRPSDGSPGGRAENTGMRGNTFTRERPALDSDSGGASRFFYTAKADAAERIRVNGVAHPTVKPLDLMRWLIRLVTPPGGLVLDPFAGSGTTVEACILERFRCVAIEREETYLPLITQRINRRRDPVAYFAASDDDPGLFGTAAAEPGGAQ